MLDISLSTVVLNSRDWPGKMASEILTCPKSTLEQALREKPIKMHWYNYNNTVSLLNIVKSRIFHPVYNSKNFVSLPASLPGVSSGSTSAMASGFSPEKR